jgi:hypothetical protein
VRRRAPARVLASLLLAALAAAGLVSCQPTGPRVVIFGDSITVESRGSGDWARILSAYQVDWSGTKFMTAPCNGLVYARNLRYVPDVVVINYSGNRGSFSENCMAGETGQALVDRYRTDVQALIDRYRNGRTKVVIVGRRPGKGTTQTATWSSTRCGTSRTTRRTGSAGTTVAACSPRIG